jgi:pimeloyl-ACP methyl ester carboxylesterase
MGWQMNYPYAMQWLGLLGGFRGAAGMDPHCPMLYIYGLRKPFMFQSTQWLEQMAARPGCAVQAFPTGHWVMVHQPAEFLACVKRWLAL